MKLMHARRIGAIKPSIFATMSQLAAEHQAVNLGQGFPDFDGPAWIVEAFIDALQSAKNQYAPMPGVQRLRRAIAGYQRTFYDIDLDAEKEITVTAGATESLFSTMLALLDPDDEVILFEPYYDSYYGNCLIAGARPVCVTLHAPEFRIDGKDLRYDGLENWLYDRTGGTDTGVPHCTSVRDVRCEHSRPARDGSWSRTAAGLPAGIPRVISAQARPSLWRPP